MKRVFCILALFTAAPALAESVRQLDAHEHGVSALNIAIDGTTVSMELMAPGADIVGFEYEAKTDADREKIDVAVAALNAPLDLFRMPDAASCTTTAAQAALRTEDDHDGHDHSSHDKEHDHDHAHDHGHENADAGHDDHGHEDHAGQTDTDGHTEFHATYTLICENPDALTGITFAYFEAFPNAEEVEVQFVTGSGAMAYEVEREEPVLDLER
jgi:hypothetical protein